MALTFPRDLVLEAYLGRWVDVTALPINRGLRQGDPVKVTWGFPTEQGKALAPPSTAEGVLNNFGGHWTPDNPFSDYWAYLRARNVPMRLSLRAQRDTFTGRTNAASWLTADTGEGWSVATSGSGVASVGSGVGTHSQPNAGAWVMTTTGDSYGDCLVAMSMPSSSIAFTSVTGAPWEPLNLVLRYQPSGALAGEHYLLRVENRTDNAIYVAVYHSGLGALSGFVGPISDALGALSQNVSLRAKFQVEGQTLRGKVYRGGPSNDPDQYEPLDWQVSAHHDRLTGGFAGVRTGVAVGNTNAKPIAANYDDWELRLARHTGELASLKPSWDEGHKIKKAAIKVADVTQRLGRPQRPALSSAARRYLASNLEFTTTDHWPLDESGTAPAQGLNAINGGESARFVRFAAAIERGAVKWGDTDAVHTSVPGFATLSNDGELVMPTNRSPLGSGASVMWAMKLSPDAGGNVWVDTNVGSQFAFVFYSDPGGKYELFGNPGSTSLASGFMTANGLAGRWVTMGLSIFPVDATHIGYHLNVDGQTLGVGSWAAGVAYSSPSAVRVHAPQPTTGGEPDCSFSSVFVTAARFDTTSGGVSYGTKASTALKGWLGERALARAFRLCFEEKVPFDYWGNFGDTPPMGPQRPIPLLDQLEECAEVDGGFLFGARYTPAVVLRSRRSMQALPAQATLSYSSGHVSGLGLGADDRPSGNLVRAQRVNGGFVIVEQTAGPMNTKDPGTDPDAIGKTPAEAVPGGANVESDASLPHVAGWKRALGTTPEARYPKVSVDLRNRDLTNGVDPTLPARSVEQLTVGDRVLVQGLTAADIYHDLDQLVRGGVETFRDVYGQVVDLNTAPYEKYRRGTWNDGAARWDTAGSTFQGALTSSTLGAQNITVTGPIWNTAAGNYPLNIVCEGEVMTISGVTGAGPTQSMTISARGVNGAAKAHPAGAAFSLATRYYHG